jgi:hypothetical protein
VGKAKPGGASKTGGVAEPVAEERHAGII